MLGKILRQLFLLIFLLIIGIATSIYWQYNKVLNQSIDIEKSDDVFSVPAGSNITDIATRLEESYGTAKWVLIFYARLHGEDTRIKAGNYRIHSGITPLELLNHMTEGYVVVHKFQFIEGHTYKELLQALASDKNIKHTLNDKSEAEIANLLGINGSLEGQFLPETYYYQHGDSDLDILKRMHQTLIDTLSQAWESRDKKITLKTPYEALILASIIEKETGVASEREQVSGVFHRRLEKNMRLQTDPSVVYGLGDEYRGKIYKSDLEKDTSYNTYLHGGLPPTPIALVGIASLHAATHPDNGDSLYFVANGGGGHTFSTTYAEHQKAVQAYRQQQSEN